MWNDLCSFLRTESYKIVEFAKCGEGTVSMVPTALWAAGVAALAHRLLGAIFRRSLFRRVSPWELLLQNLLLIWLVIYSLHFWVVLVKVLKILVEYCYDENFKTTPTHEDIESKKLMQQWVVWMCSVAPLAVYLHTRPRPDPSPLMIWITNSPWQRREMGPYGYYLNRPLAPLMPDMAIRQETLRRAFSDSKVIIKERPKKRRCSKSI